jgi:hypothetical protein
MNYLLILKNNFSFRKKITHFGISDSILRSLPNVFNTITFPINENMHIRLTVNKYIPKLKYFDIFNYFFLCIFTQFCNSH